MYAVSSVFTLIERVTTDLLNHARWGMMESFGLLPDHDFSFGPWWIIWIVVCKPGAWVPIATAIIIAQNMRWPFQAMVGNQSRLTGQPSLTQEQAYGWF
jgi:hypothetical protein